LYHGAVSGTPIAVDVVAVVTILESVDDTVTAIRGQPQGDVEDPSDVDVLDLGPVEVGAVDPPRNVAVRALGPVDLPVVEVQLQSEEGSHVVPVLDQVVEITAVEVAP